MMWALLAIATTATTATTVAGCGIWGSDEGEQVWGRTFLSTSVTERGQARPLIDGTRIRLTLDDREFKAEAGCNHLGGRARFEDGHLVVSDLESTAMGCDTARHDQDGWLAGFLSGRPAWRLDGDNLILRMENTEIVLVDTRRA